ncbi:Glutamate-1-semialdehyde 2,1-aminomutase [Geodia barretti]|uniref:Glutamate-1-semialdehyde 2,1-aminomutase n=1 Tax=Geodia barretti TaxID=519541 RepID=A0AA35W7D5_GEOBA|nr:Glutamate-1-semialdehyde 2,1-aminomutase [Geodia barretti]
MRPFPIYVERGEGVYFYDLDGHRLLDFVNNNTALILGHAHPAIVEALQDRVAKGTAFSRPTPLEVEMAELLRERVPSLERLRFCSSGTEAVLNALRVARAFTGRRKIARFEGAYHGVGEYALVSYVPPLGPDLVPSTAGLSPAVLEEVLVLPFNDADACAEIINENADDLAAVIVDPLATGAGTCLPVEGFLSRLRELTTQIGALLIFDEIISFRASPGGAQELYGVRPDLTCMAKVIAGGTAGAVFGGRADVMGTV